MHRTLHTRHATQSEFSHASPEAPGDGRAVLVCGIGLIGRQCIDALRGYNVPVRAIDLRPREQLDCNVEPGAFTQGDFRESMRVATSPGATVLPR